MTRDQRIAAVLGGAAGVLAVALILLEVGVGTGYRLLELEEGATTEVSVVGQLKEPDKLPAYDQYADILARPMFNESRKPEIAKPAEKEGAGEVGALNAALIGTIVTDTLKIAFVRDNASSEVQRVKLGQPLEGDALSGWSLTAVGARTATFEAPGKSPEELELSVDEKGAPSPTPVVPRVTQAPTAPEGQAPPPGAEPQAVAQAQQQPANADEIRRRIEERRRQLREEAQRMMQEQQQQKQQ